MGKQGNSLSTKPSDSKVKRICTNQMLSHSDARRVVRQLRTNPEVCDECDIKPCVLSLYVYGDKLGRAYSNALRPPIEETVQDG